MCGYCHAMTAKEAESFYAAVQKGTATAIPAHVLTGASPRKDLLSRQEAELLEDDAFNEAPVFRQALLSLCAEARKNGMEMYDFEQALVSLRELHRRPVWTDAQVENAIAAAERRQEQAAAAATRVAAAAYTAVARELATVDA